MAVQSVKQEQRKYLRLAYKEVRHPRAWRRVAKFGDPERAVPGTALVIGRLELSEGYL